MFVAASEREEDAWLTLLYVRTEQMLSNPDIYGDIVTDEMTTAGIKVAQLAFQGNGAQAERNGS